MVKKEFNCEVSKLLWELIKLNPRDLGLISFYLKLEYGDNCKELYSKCKKLSQSNNQDLDETSDKQA